MRNVWDFIAYVFFYDLYGFKSNIYVFNPFLNLFLCVTLEGGLVSFFCIYLSNFPNIIYRINYLESIVCACFLCQILIDYKGVGLFLGSWLCSTDLCVCFYASTMLFWLLWTYNFIIGNMIPQTLFFFLRITMGPFVFPHKFLKDLF